MTDTADLTRPISNIECRTPVEVFDIMCARIRGAALPARAPEGFVLVPEFAVNWLFGEGPDDRGFWFGDAEAPRAKGALWWRSDLRRMLSASPPPPEQGEGIGLAEPLASPAPGPADPVVRALEREIQHYIECSEHGLSKVPRGLLTRILSALQPPQPAPAPVAAQPQPSAEAVKGVAVLWGLFDERLGRVLTRTFRREDDAFAEAEARQDTRAIPLYTAPPPASDERVAEKDWRENDLDIVILSERRQAAAAMRERCAWTATSFLVGDPANGVPLRSPGPHEIAKAIRDLSLDGEG